MPQVYGMPVEALVDAMVAVACENVALGCGCTGIGKDEPASVTVPVVRETGPASAFDLEGIQMLAQLWGKPSAPPRRNGARTRQRIGLHPLESGAP